MTGSLRITKIKFRAGSAPGQPSLEIEPGSIVVFVGPNNSGKSFVLREIRGWCFDEIPSNLVIESVEFDLPEDILIAKNVLLPLAGPSEVGDPPNTMRVAKIAFNDPELTGNTIYSVYPDYHRIDLEEIENAIRVKDYKTLSKNLLPFNTILLDGYSRLSLSRARLMGNLNHAPKNHLIALFKDDNARNELRHLINEAFNYYLVLDPTSLPTLTIRMSSRLPSTTSEEQGLDDQARKFHAAAKSIDDFGDGVRAFVGILSAVVSHLFRVILIDEPEAFLHPPLARRLGGNLARISRQRDASLIVSTHSSEFLFGCLETAPDTTVVRLTYEEGIATARNLPADELKIMIRDPLLRSTGVLRALFHRAAVVTESEADRAFYDETNQRLLSEGRGIKDALFTQAQNKDTIWRLISPLRSLGIPAAAIIDLDILKVNWGKTLKACQVPDSEYVRLGNERSYLATAFSSVPLLPDEKDAMKTRGINALNPTDKIRAEVLLNELSEYGLFIVPNGELESWLKPLGVTGHGPEWLIKMFSVIGQSEDDPNYLKPSSGDIWEFLEKIAAWVEDPNRRGIG